MNVISIVDAVKRETFDGKEGSSYCYGARTAPASARIGSRAPSLFFISHARAGKIQETRQEGRVFLIIGRYVAK